MRGMMQLGGVGALSSHILGCDDPVAMLCCRSADMPSGVKKGASPHYLFWGLRQYDGNQPDIREGSPPSPVGLEFAWLMLLPLAWLSNGVCREVE
ncbi:hypothetical protein FOZ60_001773 [Perkinsus olseni]|uniref:Uncharacterized protein n=1 Tax=Perkinsus olseni TaxID=32597 RepID=A0A7J6P0N6_PEROL|nr:hypothetical protein FOZ60_001773 [Perkinsus olseni]